MRKPAQIMGQPEGWCFADLPRPGPALHLQIKLINHAQPRGADRMAEAFQPPSIWQGIAPSAS